jgi:multisubunit Na+/H+ antiporter MnhF subunit
MAEMTPLLSIASVLSGLNILLLLIVGAVWARNYRAFKSPLTIGLLGFAGVLIVENLIALSFFFSMGMLYAGSAAAQQAVLAMRALQFVAILFLTVVSLR